MPASLALSYCGPAPLPDDLWGRWNFDPWLIATMVIAAGLFALIRPSRDEQLRFAISLVVLGLIFISPLCALTVALFSARVVHHVLLVAVAAPLLAWAVASRIPSAFAQRAESLLSPLVLLHTAVFWIWHAPDAYNAALSDTAVYWLMQVSLFGTAVVMWCALIVTSAGRAIAAVLFLTVQMGFLGALLVFTGHPLYVPHFVTTTPFGLDPLTDQQLAGLIMWVPASVPYVAVGLWRLLTVLRETPEQRA